MRMFFVSDPDFEFANFTLGELVEVLWGRRRGERRAPEGEAEAAGTYGGR